MSARYRNELRNALDYRFDLRIGIKTIGIRNGAIPRCQSSKILATYVRGLLNEARPCRYVSLDCFHCPRLFLLFFLFSFFFFIFFVSTMAMCCARNNHVLVQMSIRDPLSIGMASIDLVAKSFPY